MPKTALAPALLLGTLMFGTAPALAQQAPPAAPAPTPAKPPKLIVAISVDQFSADLFAQYRSRFTSGMARLTRGVVFPSAYQSHAATETCPGHSTILTGVRPGRNGVIANNYVDQRVTRKDTIVYCAEDETIPGTDRDHYVVSDQHLKVPTLGERMKAANPATRVVSVAGKDRAAVMMGGHRQAIDEIWWWRDQKGDPDARKTFTTYEGRAEPPVVTRAKRSVAAMIAQAQPPLPLPGWCKPLDQPITAGTQIVGQGRFARAAGNYSAFKASPASDAAVLALSAGLIQDMQLGKRGATDLIAIGLSATDYIGHANGTQGTEMCIQMDQLDQALGGFFDVLDETGVEYEVMLTADHGAHDMTERQQARAMPMEAHVAPALSVTDIGKAIGQDLGVAGPVLLSAESDIYVDRALPAPVRARVLAEAQRRYRAFPQVAAALTRAEIAATAIPTTPPETWTLIERARASYDPDRSGDLLILLKPRITSIVTPAAGYVETHGSPWDYDRRVPLLFWRKGMVGFEQALSVETVDIAPTLAATIGLATPGVDGRCLDLDAGAGDTCAAR
ncbi:MAG TPA: alkaline phosphatase family protein [Sphingomonas sp.]|nr:alkaline phosphatase family protein [Sphingomonas sp.]